MKFSELIGKTITSAQQMQSVGYTDTGYLKLGFSDRTECVIYSSYGDFDFKSEGEYPSEIYIIDKYTEEELVPIENINKP